MELDEKSVKIERLYALHKNVMLYTAERILRDYQLAEDAVQKAFMKVLDNLHKIEEPDCNKTRAFLVIITRNVAITMYNRLLRRSNPQNILIIFIKTINVIARQGKRSSRISMNVHEIIGLFIQDVYAFTIGTYPNITIPIIYDSFYNIRLYSLFARKLKHLSILNIITL